MYAQPDFSADPPPTSRRGMAALRAAVSDGDGETVSIREIIRRLDQRAFGMGVLLFMTPVCLPMPPGVHTLAGALLLLFAIQLTLGRKNLWLPRRISDRRINKARILRGLDRIGRYTAPVERLARPRWPRMTGGLGSRLIGVILVLLALVLILPIPILGNLPPAIAACILALSLAERDGLLVFFGVIASIVAVIITSALAIGAIRALTAVF